MAEEPYEPGKYYKSRVLLSNRKKLRDLFHALSLLRNNPSHLHNLLVETLTKSGNLDHCKGERFC